MKNSTNHILFTLFLAFISIALFSQSPDAIKYQGVVRDAAGVLIEEQAVSFQFKIHDGSSTGPIVYTETHTVNTNKYGVVTLEIGKGSTSDALSSVAWGSGDKFLEILIDLSGGSSYTTMGSFQLVSVPYALYANETGTVSDNAISSSKIQSNAVTLDKINNSGASSGDVLMFDGSSLSWGTVATSSGDITSVTAGDGLTGGAVSGDAALNIGAGTGITVGTDNISLDETHTNALYVNEGQNNSVSTTMIQDAAITNAKVSGSGASSGQVLSYNGTNVAWTTPASSSGNTLDQAYDEGGAGAGRVINATDGAVYITGTGGLYSDGGISVGMNSATDDDAITFDYASTPERIIWDNSESKFYMTDDLRVYGTIGNSTATVPYNTLFDNGSAAAPSSGQMGNEGDLYIEYDLEVGNDIYVGGDLRGNVPGIASNNASSWVTITSTTPMNVTSRSITAPGPGYVLACFTGSASIHGTSIGDFYISINNVSATVHSSSAVYFGHNNSPQTAIRYFFGSLSTQRVFNISSAGTYTYYVVGRKGSYSGGTHRIGMGTFTLMYIPTAHGVVSTSEEPSTLSQGPDDL